MTTKHFIAMACNDEQSAYALNKWLSSRTKSLPALPNGTVKLFNLQCTYAAVIALLTSEQSASPHAKKDVSAAALWAGKAGGRH